MALRHNVSHRKLEFLGPTRPKGTSNALALRTYEERKTVSKHFE